MDSEVFKWLDKVSAEANISPIEADIISKAYELPPEKRIALLKELAKALQFDQLREIKEKIDYLKSKRERLVEEKKRITLKIHRIDHEIKELEYRLHKVKVNKKSITIRV